MRLKLDENMPSFLRVLLVQAGHDVHTVADERLSGAEDPEILAAATVERRVVVTFDRDFEDFRLSPPSTHAGVILLRLPNRARALIVDAIERVFAEPQVEPLDGTLVVVFPDAVRIRRQP